MKLIMMYKHREELGEQLEIVVLEMPVEEQMERVRGRNGGSQHVVDKMKVRFLLARYCPLDSVQYLEKIWITDSVQLAKFSYQHSASPFEVREMSSSTVLPLIFSE